jgi:hypothetical protein
VILQKQKKPCCYRGVIRDAGRNAVPGLLVIPRIDIGDDGATEDEPGRGDDPP